MKVISSSQMAKLESVAYQEGYSPEEFMENAGRAIAEQIEQYLLLHTAIKKIIFVCGKGNNGGDGYVAARYLFDRGYEMTLYQVGLFEESSALCKKNSIRLKDKGLAIHYIQSAKELDCSESSLLIDALFGTGINKPLSEPYLSIIEKMNHSKLPIISVDIPSGLDGNRGLPLGTAIHAQLTLCLGYPKIGFFIREGWNFIGRLHHLSFGLPSDIPFESNLELFEIKSLKYSFPKIKANRHKYEAGFVFALAGSPGMAGAALISSLACLKGGAGIVKLLFPEGMQQELALSPYELIKIAYGPSDHQRIVDYFKKASALLIGPGLGKKAETVQLLKTILPQLERPSVIDADALNIIAETKIAFPKNCVITPHRGEMLRLLGGEISSQQFDDQLFTICQTYVEAHQIVLVLKGGPTFVFSPSNSAIVIPFGDPGMATAGSGDALTGLLSALLAQGLTPKDAAVNAVFLHAYAGESAAAALTSYCMTATDIIHHFPKAFELI